MGRVKSPGTFRCGAPLHRVLSVVIGLTILRDRNSSQRERPAFELPLHRGKVGAESEVFSKAHRRSVHLAPSLPFLGYESHFLELLQVLVGCRTAPLDKFSRGYGLEEGYERKRPEGGLGEKRACGELSRSLRVLRLQLHGELRSWIFDDFDCLHGPVDHSGNFTGDCSRLPLRRSSRYVGYLVHSQRPPGGIERCLHLRHDLTRRELLQRFTQIVPPTRPARPRPTP